MTASRPLSKTRRCAWRVAGQRKLKTQAILKSISKSNTTLESEVETLQAEKESLKHTTEQIIA